MRKGSAGRTAVAMKKLKAIDKNYRIDRLGLSDFGDRVLDRGRDDARAAAAFVAHVLGAFQVGHISDESVESRGLRQLPSSFNQKQ